MAFTTVLDARYGRANDIHYEGKVTTIGSMNIEVVFEGGKILFARVICVRVKFGQVSEDAELTARGLVGLIRRQNFDGDIMMKSHTLGLAVMNHIHISSIS